LLLFGKLSQGRVAVTSALIMVTILFAMVNVRNVYAQTVTVTPSAVTGGGTFRVSGTGFDPSSAGLAEVWASTSGSCMGNPALLQNVTSDSSGNVTAVTFSSSSLGVGTHCVGVVTFAYDTAASSVVTVISEVATTAP
jgi:hypothetical protein